MDQEHTFAGVAKMVIGFLIAHFILVRTIYLNLETAGMLAGIAVGLLAILAFVRSIGVVGSSIGGKDLKWRQIPLPVRLVAYLFRVMAGIALAVFIGRFLWLYVPAVLQLVYGDVVEVDLLVITADSINWMTLQALNNIDDVTLSSLPTAGEWGGISDLFSSSIVTTVMVESFWIVWTMQMIASLWVLSNRDDRHRFWQSFGKLGIVEHRAKFVFYTLQLTSICFAVLRQWETSLIASLVAAAVGCTILLLPQMTGMFLWFAEEVVHLDFGKLLSRIPKFLFGKYSWPFIAGSKSKQRTRSNRHEEYREYNHHEQRQKTYRQTGGDRHNDRKDWTSQNSPPDDGDSTYHRALAILGLEEGGFTKEEARAQWKKLMARTHPDQGGTDELAKQINAAWQLIKTRHAW
ncbi:J domain-containing protein [Parvularcula marina]|uniref:J domain-containing protein n=1 Tax=Parvularcula marina TaxID=2292771 RepID=A0A371RL69_9PROT|nr:J domain-containing protein [Parvularcula marina]RFB06212.1 J domain-containing protein [Parvularcula marina]